MGCATVAAALSSTLLSALVDASHGFVEGHHHQAYSWILWMRRVLLPPSPFHFLPHFYWPTALQTQRCLNLEHGSEQSAIMCAATFIREAMSDDWVGGKERGVDFVLELTDRTAFSSQCCHMRELQMR